MVAIFSVLIRLLLLLAAAAAAAAAAAVVGGGLQTATFKGSPEMLLNPERGFRHEIDTGCDQGPAANARFKVCKDGTGSSGTSQGAKSTFPGLAATPFYTARNTSNTKGAKGATMSLPDIAVEFITVTLTNIQSTCVGHRRLE